MSKVNKVKRELRIKCTKMEDVRRFLIGASHTSYGLCLCVGGLLQHHASTNKQLKYCLSRWYQLKCTILWVSACHRCVNKAGPKTRRAGVLQSDILVKYNDRIIELYNAESIRLKLKERKILPRTISGRGVIYI